MIHWFQVYWRCNSDCAVPLRRDPTAKVGDFKRCEHGQVYVCAKKFGVMDVAAWERVSPIFNFRLYRNAILTLNGEARNRIWGWLPQPPPRAAFDT